MSPLKLFIILSFLLGVAVTIRARPTYLYHVCPNTTTFTANSTYQANRNILLSSLSSNATANKYNIGFYNTSTGRDPDDIYGLFLCRGDFSSDVCQTCVTFATQDIVERCPVEKVAIIWYDECLLRYSNQFFFSSISQDPSAYLVNTQNISDQNRFNELLSNAMEDAATEAANAASGAKKFAVKETKFTGFQNLYNLVQCTPDLSSSDCNRCLEIAIAKLPSCCDGKQGGRVLSPSCNIRYEVYPFYNATSTRAPPPSPPVVPPPLTGSGQGKSGISVVTIVAIVAPISISIVLFCMGYCFLRRRARKKYDAIEEDGGNEISTVESLQFDLSMIEAATNNFSDDNKLGEGGFGGVYTGTLPNGREIAVKRLSRSSEQEAEEFKNEVLLLAKLQHRNLVRLIGFCLEGEEKILVYEFVPNKSLDYFLFDPEKQGKLD
ncbi:cysteine-rich receptor-like protein kinase 10 isoform X2 [Hevea brasiliensis]|uniref:cysteine-rich receptor-like protein kinase 10 isoform X2 n=1 Tax=Hevea brasiliensis TaxID=3981 RepID=UPI0025F152A4|nr:cysteine-rich receptor-like protein kinase 10 isoform X2 [Hevea brasiliensis]